MKQTVAVFCIVMVVLGCKTKRNLPDVSGIKIAVQVKRFDKDFFAIDTNNIPASLTALQQKYPGFLNDFLYNIMALPPQEDSLVKGLKLFLHDPNYIRIHDSVNIQFANFEPYRKAVEKGLQYTKYYFPAYKLPKQIITFTGPVEGYGNVITGSGLAVGLQLYLGKTFPAYHTDYISQVYPEYQSRRFEPAYIAVNCMKNIIDELYADDNPNKASRPLIEQMIESGKRLYVLDQLLPETADSLKTGYTQSQLDGCIQNEAYIWNFFVQNDLLYAADPSLTRDYVTDGPKTSTLGDASPGNIGQFVGWQIVKKWMEKNAQKTLPQLLQTPARQIFEEAKYKPR